MSRRTLEYARRFVFKAGYSVIAIGVNKRPVGPWKEFQEHRPSLRDLKDWYDRPNTDHGIGLVHGAISGNSEAIDFDHKGIGIEFYMKAYTAVPEIAGAPWVRTPRPGYQLFYRLNTQPPGNLKLAEVPNPEWTEGVVGIPKWKTVIETRGEGGYTVAVGSPPQCHPNNRPYELVFGSFTTVPVLTADGRAKLMELAAGYDQRPPGDRDHHSQHYGPRTDDGDGGLRPGDDFAKHVDWATILERHHWTFAYRLDGVRYWTRPGKRVSEGHSASTEYGDSDLLYVFSSNASPFEAGHSYSKFAAFALLEHNGDFTAAARELAERWRYGR